MFLFACLIRLPTAYFGRSAKAMILFVAQDFTRNIYFSPTEAGLRLRLPSRIRWMHRDKGTLGIFGVTRGVPSSLTGPKICFDNMATAIMGGGLLK